MNRDVSVQCNPEFEFDVVFYRSSNPDLVSFDNEQLLKHFVNNGVCEGRLGSPFGAKEIFIKQIDLNGRVLEIGPFCNPCLVGAGVHYFDVLNVADLLSRANHIGCNTNNAPKKIDYVSAVGDLSIIEGTFDSIFSSHNIEHQYDLIHHLRDVSSILNSGGRYYLCVPDKRYTFDYYLPESRLVDVLGAHDRKLRRHTLDSVLEHRAYIAHNDPVRHWNGDHGCDPVLENDHLSKVDKAMKEFYSNNSIYIDVHAWKFTPESFFRIINELRMLKLTDFVINKIYNTPRLRMEFCAILSKQ